MAATLVYIAGDALWRRGELHDSLPLRRAGAALVALAVTALITDGFALYVLFARPISAVWGG